MLNLSSSKWTSTCQRSQVEYQEISNKETPKKEDVATGVFSKMRTVGFLKGSSRVSAREYVCVCALRY